MPGFAGAVSVMDHGNQHQRERARAFAALPEWSPCARCHHPMWKWDTQVDRLGRKRSTLHYDHDEDGGYLGFSHARCNLRAGASKGGAVAAAVYYKRGTIRDCIQCGQRFRAWHPEQSRCSKPCRSPRVPSTVPVERIYRCQYCGREGKQQARGRNRKVCHRPVCLRQHRMEAARKWRASNPAFPSSAGHSRQAPLW